MDRPASSAIYRGVVGRSVTQLGPDVWRIQPPQLGNTWAADNLAKVDHIVVVMMENRSFDHVLGYRAQLPGVAGSDGLTPELLQSLQDAGFALPPLAQSKLLVKTQFPVAVGHELHDVAEQLAHRLQGPGSRTIVSPEGYVANFKPRHDRLSAQDKARVKLHDVLGCDGQDLPFFRFWPRTARTASSTSACRSDAAEPHVLVTGDANTTALARPSSATTTATTLPVRAFDLRPVHAVGRTGASTSLSCR